MFLADLAAAFPSIAISWLLRALVLMQVYPGVAAFLVALYTGHLGHLCFGGKRRGSARLDRGVRQGGPSSMLLLA
eukprot:6546970-Pyramimonas_sp.AAC.1